ncbi:MAG TPA: proline dehydrogenase family protein [Trebonia sp.]|nr:proline dehydrogenase family protein [Trebonia sp.]
MLRRALLAASSSNQVRGLLTGTPMARAVVARYVAGEGIRDVVRAARDLRAAGLLVTVDYLGEDTTDALAAARVAAQYMSLLDTLGAAGLTEGGAVEVSVKASAVGQRLGDGDAAGAVPGALGEKIAREHIERIASRAQSLGTTVTVDAEDHHTTDGALAIAGALREQYPGVGSVLQAALRRTEADARALATAGTRVRLCKGAYNEPASEAHAERHDIDKAYARCLRVLMEGDGYPMIATHDPRLIAIATALGLRREPGTFEYQMLYGIRPGEQARLAATGAKVRVYVPYGSDWYGYLTRRLAERPASLGLLARSLVPSVRRSRA